MGVEYSYDRTSSREGLLVYDPSSNEIPSQTQRSGGAGAGTSGTGSGSTGEPSAPHVVTNHAYYGAMPPPPEVQARDASLESFGRQGTGPSPWLERPFWIRIPGVPLQQEATGQAMDASAKGILHVSTAFLGPALIHLATASAQEQYCTDQQQQTATGGTDGSYDQCSPTDADDLRVFGLRPSSILTVSSVTATAAAAITLPFIGVLIDQSSHRKTVGAVTAFCLVFLNAIQVLLSQSAWPFFWISKTVADYLYMVHNMVCLAFMQNLTTNSDVLASYSSKFSILHFGFTAAYSALVILYAAGTQAGIVQTSRVAHGVSAVVGFCILQYAWTHLFGHRPQRRESAESLVSNTVLALGATLGKIRRHYPALKWFLITLLWSPDMGSGTLMSIFGTLQKSLLQMTSTQIGIFNLVVLVSTIVGAKWAGFLNATLNPLVSFRLCLVALAVVTALMAGLIAGPDQLGLFYLLSAGIGIVLGWLVPTERVLFCTLAPVGHEAEMMGLILCVHSMAAWVPPLLFSIMNEAGFSLRWALASQDVLYAFALVASLGVGDYETALAQARDTSKLG